MFKNFSAHIVLVRVTLCVLSLVTTPAAASAGGSYDGSWNVRIVTNHGVCDSGATVPIHVNDGNIGSELSIVKVSGQVAQSGALNVNVSSGVEHATGVGHLSENSGSGTWKAGVCSGTWTASKN